MKTSTFYKEHTVESAHYDSADDLKDMESQEIGRTVAEDDIAPEIIKQRDNLELVYGHTKKGAESGIDLIVYDKDAEEYVIIEVKFTTKNDRIGKELFGSTRMVDGDEVEQMTDGWIEDAFNEEFDPDTVPDELEAAIESKSYRREAVVIQDSSTPKTVRDGMNDRIDELIVIRTNAVTKSD